MLPVTRGVSILIRGEEAMAASRPTTGAAEPGWIGGAAPLPEGVAPGVALSVFGAAFASFALRLLGGAPLLHLRHVEEILPADQHQAGQNDGKDRIAVVGHRSGLVIQVWLRLRHAFS